MKRFIYLLLFVLVSTAFLKGYANDLPASKYSINNNQLAFGLFKHTPLTATPPGITYYCLGYHIT